MGGIVNTIYARNMVELEKKVHEWIIEARTKGYKYIRKGWNPKRVSKTFRGYEIEVDAHS